MILALMLATLFWLSGVALADGGGPEEPSSDCTCLDTMNPPPQPTSGPFLLGEFTVARDRKTFDDGVEGHFNIHVTLRRLGEAHLFHTWRRVPEGIIGGDYRICDLTDAQLKQAYKRLACDMGVEQHFGLTGTPLIFSLCVTQRECVSVEEYPLDTAEQMIKGVIVLRVVPTITCQ